MSDLDVAVIGGGQAALAAGYFLRRSGLSFQLLDAEPEPGGAWRHTWPSLRLFSPARWSSLPGWLMPPTSATYPTRDEALAYLAAYEQRYELPVRRPVRVRSVERAGEDLRLLLADGGELVARAVISATGTWSRPHRPQFTGQEQFAGRIVHSAEHAGPASFSGQRVLVVGAGNSGAQIFADLVDHADVQWVTQEPPVFLPDDVDGQVLFDQATVRYQAIKEGRTPPPPRSLGDIVMVESVRAIRERGLLEARPLFTQLTANGVQWPDGSSSAVDAIILATGFRPALDHLAPLATPNERGRLEMDGLHAAAHPRLFPLGYGNWTGFASATLVGAGRAAKAVVDAVTKTLS
ncbi:MAG: NAD(P)-binding domain-containing protein [Gemmatimonadaceae bacterium]|nr:NAD(P)-binding domain-containing protein [Gemmatimonadaceae bacterium]MCW5825281.1 NAD(P)-binding domain-containing protein [Gemmatimonadaceae bacterium]